MKMIMYPHAGCYNHGCEAIIRSTVKLFDAAKEDVLLYSSAPDNDARFGLDEVVTIIPNDSANKSISSIRRLSFILREKFLKGDRDLEEISFRHNNFINNSKKAVAISVGGDNYCYTGMQHMLSEFSKLLEYKNIPSILWGCSMDEKLITNDIIKQLKQYRLITVRESISAGILYDLGLGDKVINCADPAFILDPEPIHEYDSFFSGHPVIGLNISPLMNRYDAYPKATSLNFTNLLLGLLKQTKYNIALIPHVRQKNNDDYLAADSIIHDLPEKNSKRILNIRDDLNCKQLKYIISMCKMFIGCRTHATIAAYSSCVPTLVVGYSNKSKGICNDLFGTCDNYLIDARKLQRDDELLHLFDKFAEQENDTREKLKRIIPDYKLKTYAAKNAVNSLFE